MIPYLYILRADRCKLDSTPHIVKIFFFRWELFKIYSLSNFHIYINTTQYYWLWSPCCTSHPQDLLMNGDLYLMTHLPITPPLPLGSTCLFPESKLQTWYPSLLNISVFLCLKKEFPVAQMMNSLPAMQELLLLLLLSRFSRVRLCATP